MDKQRLTLNGIETGEEINYENLNEEIERDIQNTILQIENLNGPAIPSSPQPSTSGTQIKEDLNFDFDEEEIENEYKIDEELQEAIENIIALNSKVESISTIVEGSQQENPPPTGETRVISEPLPHENKRKLGGKMTVSLSKCSKIVEIKEKIDCEVCHKVFKTPLDLRHHSQTHTRVKKELYFCELCPKKSGFSYKHNLLRHKRHFHASSKEEEKKIYSVILCEKCGILHPEKGACSEKRKKETLLCEKCGKFFKSAVMEHQNCQDCTRLVDSIQHSLIGRGEERKKGGKKKENTTQGDREEMTTLCEKCGKMTRKKLKKGMWLCEHCERNELDEDDFEKTKKHFVIGKGKSKGGGKGKGKGKAKNCQAGENKKKNNEGRKKAQLHCHNCEHVCRNSKEMYEHRMRHHQSSSTLQQQPWEQEGRKAPWEDEENRIDAKLQNIYTLHKTLILRGAQYGLISNSYNFPIDNHVNVHKMKQHTQDIFNRQKNAFKINIAFGFILKNTETGEYRYFKAYENQTVLKRPFLISNRGDIEQLAEELQQLDIIELILKQRENSKYKPILLTNIIYTVYSTNFRLGSDILLPDFIKFNKAIIGLETNVKGKAFKKKNLCVFRCLTAHFYPELYKKKLPGQIETVTSQYLLRWLQYKGEKYTGEHFPGVDIENMCNIESCFNININIFSLNEDSTCENVYKSPGQFETTMNLNLYGNHVSYIKEMNLYCKQFQCKICGRYFKRKDHWKRHLKNCDDKLKLEFPGGFFKPPKTVFQDLESFGIRIPPQQSIFREFIVFDMEAMLIPTQESNSEKLTWTHRHHPISVGICSNFKEYKEPFCIVNAKEEELITEMVVYMTKIADAIRKEKEQLYESVFEEMNELEEKWSRDEYSPQVSKMMIKQIRFLKRKMELYCSQIPVLGFNSARYDLNLIKGKIIKALDLAKQKQDVFVIKKNNSYSCIANHSFKFLDISQFLSPGTSYAKFLKAFEVKENKGIFPYEYLNDEEKLKETSLPLPGHAWWSKLKNKNLLGDTEESIKENYSWLQNIWRKENMQTMEDFLKWYNCLDVFPFVKATERLCEFYFEKGIDVFKVAISVPGLARKMVFEEALKAKATFSLIDQANQDLYHMIERNLVGGPSIIFTRHHKVNETFIRNDPNHLCKKIIGFDANALYLYCFDKDMPVGYFVRRRKENNFKPKSGVKYSNMFYWMDWINLTQNSNIEHLRNSGKEKRVGPYLVDGFEASSQTIYQYHGCYFHGHGCYLTKHITTQEGKAFQERKKENTERCRDFLKQENYEVIEMYECEFYQLIKQDRDLKDFIDAQKPPFYKKNPGEVDEEDILEAVKAGDLFGMVEVDISVPESWDEVSCRPKTFLSPKEYFHEMTPLFGNAEIEFKDIGEHMQQYIIDNDLNQDSRRLLIGAMKAEKMLIATPLLKWYLRHGMKISKIHEVIEYNSSPCFEEFVKKVSEARRKGDIDVSKAVLADTMKLIGNSAFGSMIMNKTKHRKVYFVEGYQNAAKEVNDPKFERLNEIEQDYYEIEAFKKKKFSIFLHS